MKHKVKTLQEIDHKKKIIFDELKTDPKSVLFFDR